MGTRGKKKEFASQHNSKGQHESQHAEESGEQEFEVDLDGSDAEGLDADTARPAAPSPKRQLEATAADKGKRVSRKKSRAAVQLVLSTVQEAAPVGVQPGSHPEAHKATHSNPESTSSEQPAASTSTRPYAALRNQRLTGDATKDAVMFLRRRMVRVQGEDVSTLRLRPQLEAVHDTLVDCFAMAMEEPGQNNSILLFGGRGSGKSVVVERALTTLTALKNTDPENPSVGVVRLNGLIHGVDERAALRSMARQLCSAFGMVFARTASFEENLCFLREVLRDLCRAFKTAIFVLDEFDLFAKRGRQTVLYNLFDAIVASGVQAAVVGVTVRKDAVELLEKRVRSRFSHRRIFLPDPADVHPPLGSHPAAWVANAEAAADPNSKEGLLIDVLEALLTLPADFAHAAYAARFNAALRSVLTDEAVANAFCTQFSQGCPPRLLAHIAGHALLQIDGENGLLERKHFLSGVQQALLDVQNCQVQAIASLSILELFMLVGTFRLVSRGRQAVNFAMVHEEYCKLAHLDGNVDVYSRHAAFCAFTKLTDMAITLHSDHRGDRKGGRREYHGVSLNVGREEIEQGLKRHRGIPLILRDWLDKEAVTSTAMM